jgi:hypothetical protein
MIPFPLAQEKKVVQIPHPVSRATQADDQPPQDLPPRLFWFPEQFTRGQQDERATSTSLWHARVLAIGRGMVLGIDFRVPRIALDEKERLEAGV